MLSDFIDVLLLLHFRVGT